MNVQRPTPRVEPPIRPEPLTDDAALALAELRDTAALMAEAAALRDEAFGAVMTYSRKVFIPLTHLCRDSCHYCTFATPPRRASRLHVARGGSRGGAGRSSGRMHGGAVHARRQAGAALSGGSAALTALGHARRSTISREWRELVIEKPGCCRISIPA